MRTIKHGTQVNTKVDVVDEPSLDNGANHQYQVTTTTSECELYTEINFQNGPVKEVGVNGIHNEDLLIIVMDRLEGFQRGQFACDANKYTLALLQGALTELNVRTKDRQERGVEGTNQL